MTSVSDIHNASISQAAKPMPLTQRWTWMLRAIGRKLNRPAAIGKPLLPVSAADRPTLRPFDRCWNSKRLFPAIKEVDRCSAQDQHRAEG